MSRGHFQKDLGQKPSRKPAPEAIFTARTLYRRPRELFDEPGVRTNVHIRTHLRAKPPLLPGHWCDLGPPARALVSLREHYERRGEVESRAVVCVVRVVRA